MTGKTRNTKKAKMTVKKGNMRRIHGTRICRLLKHGRELVLRRKQVMRVTRQVRAKLKTVNRREPVPGL